MTEGNANSEIERVIAAAIEYGLIAALISIAAISAFNAVGSSLTATFNRVSSKL